MYNTASLSNPISCWLMYFNWLVKTKTMITKVMEHVNWTTVRFLRKNTPKENLPALTLSPFKAL
uniref:hypothetical protein n=1 Tax=Algoriphagus iocasae TaxID=1836499 RepID=UPI0037427B68